MPLWSYRSINLRYRADDPLGDWEKQSYIRLIKEFWTFVGAFIEVSVEWQGLALESWRNKNINSK